MSDISDNSIMGDPYHAEGAINMRFDPKSGPQAMPSHNIQNAGALMGNMFPVDSVVADSSPSLDGHSDDSRQDIVSPDLQGGLDDDGCGIDVDFGAQAPFSNPDYPSATKPPQTGFAGSLRGISNLID